MVLRKDKEKDKEDKLAVRPKEKEGEITSVRPFDLWTEMDRMFDDFRSGFYDLFVPLGFGSRRAISALSETRMPLTDVADLGDRFELRAEMPGMPKENINIEVTPTGIEISAKHEEGKEDKGKNWLRRERSSMSFFRSLELPEEIKSEDVEAEMTDGVLKVMLPKLEPKPEIKTKKVEIK
ncbi:MAG: Hsp20/alpha crystallin family protein [Methanocellales archaeon]|nr:Hsp20/alpha crystallin family protein [Methanocellales archaeon]MDD3291546.1 Hsp20/alpha crystallin family protein [Methanocellales archaeon]MDD5235835.1 Hsp20/alpha crystallin family protein [Methanocellales archaeon]MDD5485328.1 Hsp20/alpha crystallin family protein [Methanocellales archaeon]